MSWSYDNLLMCLQSGISYLAVTVKLTFLPYLIGILVGLPIAIVRTYRVRVISPVLAILITIYRGIPPVIALMIFHLLYILKFDDFSAAFHLPFRVENMDIIVVGYFTLSLLQVVLQSETYRGAMRGIAKEQYEAGYSVGLTKWQTLRRIILPQMLPISIPGMINNFVGAVKATSLVLAIGIVDVMAGSIIPCGITYSFTEGYLAAALIYWIFSFTIETIAKYIEKRSKNFRRKTE